MRSSHFKKQLIYMLVVVLSCTGVFVSASVNAAMIDTERLAQEITVDMQRTELNSLLAKCPGAGCQPERCRGKQPA